MLSYADWVLVLDMLMSGYTLSLAMLLCYGYRVLMLLRI